MNVLSLPIVVVVGSMALAIAGMYLGVKLISALACLIGRLVRFVLHEVRDSLLFFATVIRAVFTLPRVLLAVILGRWSAVRHHGVTIETEVIRAGRLGYQVVIGNLLEALQVEAHLVIDLDDEDEALAAEPQPEPGQSPSDYLAQRKPTAAPKARLAAMAAKPGRDQPRKADAFEGYQVVGSLPTGGSGAKIYVADLDADKRRALQASGLEVPEQVVIKCFQLDEGSNLSQIVRESRALESAKRLGMVLEHGLDERRYFYVMPYVPGENLSRVTERMHAAAGSEGLGQKPLKQAFGYLADLLVTLDRFHRAGLWHKDVKPDNIIVRSGRAHLVDLGLVTPLGSAMTLTTHGTEYFRDPELVRQALRGAKVHEVDGARFDLYAAGAVLYSVVENSFPAHGSLSSISKRCPDAVHWVVRRAMADLDSRYSSAAEMLADVRALQEARDPFAVKPAQLPSMGGAPVADLPEPPPSQALPPLPSAGTAAAAASAAPPPVPGGEHYQPGPRTAAFAEESVKRMPPPVPSKAKAHALNAAREAKQALEAVRHARWDARDARKRARAALAEARKRAAAVRAQVGRKSAVVIEKLPERTRQAWAASKPLSGRELRRATQAEARAKARARHSGGPTWGGWAAVGALLLVGLAGLGLAVGSTRSHQVQYGPVQLAKPAPGRVTIQSGSSTTEIHYGAPASSAAAPPRPSASASPAPATATRLFSEVRPSTGELSVASAYALIGESGDPAPGADFPVERGKGRVLMLDGYSEAGDEQAASYAGLLETLRQAGFGVVALDYQGDQEDEVLEALAAAQAALGLYSPREVNTRRALHEHLVEHPELDAIVWVGPTADGARVEGHALLQGGYSSQRLLETLRSATHAAD